MTAPRKPLTLRSPMFELMPQDPRDTCSDERREDIFDADAHRIAQELGAPGVAPRRCPQCHGWSAAFPGWEGCYECPNHGKWKTSDTREELAATPAIPAHAIDKIAHLEASLEQAVRRGDAYRSEREAAAARAAELNRELGEERRARARAESARDRAQGSLNAAKPEMVALRYRVAELEAAVKKAKP